MKRNNQFKRARISLKTKKIFEELVNKYRQLEKAYDEIYFLTEEFNEDLRSVNLDYDRHNQIISIFENLNVEFPWSITYDFIDHMKDIANDQDIPDNHFFEILVNERNID